MDMIKIHNRKVYWKTKPSFYKKILVMKKVMLKVRWRFLMLVSVFIFVVAAARAQPQLRPSESHGLISRLIEIKYTTELYASSRGKNDTAMAIYNTLRWKIDGLVYQLSGDMIAANSPSKFIKLDMWCLKQPEELKESMKRSPNCNPRITVYLLALNEIDAFYRTNIIGNIVPTTKLKTLNLTTNVFYLLKDSYTIIKGLSDMKTQKTMALVELLDHTRLLSIGEIGKMGR